jgi:Alpha/beta hydrolase domain
MSDFGRLARFLPLIAAALLLPGAVHARVTHIAVTKTDSAFHGQAFGGTGAYEIVKGTVTGELDSADRRNVLITDIQFAPRNAAGKVTYTTTFTILKPVDMSKANGTMVYDVTNRGNPRFVSRFTRFVLAGGPGDLELADPGDGSVYRAGYVVVTSGWQGDLPIDSVGPGREGINVPIAKNPDGSSITGPVVVRFAAGAPGNVVVPFSGNGNTLALPGPGRTPATLDTAKATLVSKASETQSGVGGGVVSIPSADWAFADCRTTPFPGKPDPSRICLKNGFDPARLYELVYTAKDPFVLGVGLAAARDLVSFLRRESKDASGAPNPLAGTIAHVIGYGVSQPGRMMRDYINLGFNEDESGRAVWDGAFLDASAAAGQFNIRFAQPGNIAGLYDPIAEGPAWWEDYTDKVRDRPAWGLLHRCRATNTCPLVMEIEGGADFWFVKGSLGIAGTSGKDDIPLPANVRRYYMASTNHTGGADNFSLEQPPVASCMLPANPLPWIETERALLAAMLDWIAKGTLPPPSAYPRVTDGTLVPATAAAMAWPAIPGAPSPDGVMNSVLDYDFGPNFRYNDHSGIIDNVPPPVKRVIPTLAAKADADGNEIAGVRALLLQVPLGTYTGWNPVSSGVLKGQECQLQAGTIPFARTKAERMAKGDPRPSLEERYGNLSHYYSLAVEAANKLVAQRFLLPGDADREIRQMLNDMLKSGALPLVGQASGLSKKDKQ